jgi:hypothetical protein
LGELWADIRSHPDYPTWQQLARRRGLTPDEDSLGYHMTRGLILEVIHAVGGVERELAQVHAALEEAQAWTDQAVSSFPRDRERPLRDVDAAAPSLVDVSYAFVNLLIGHAPSENGSSDRGGRGRRGEVGCFQP